MTFDYAGAVNAGYSDEEIVGHLASSNSDFDVEGAVRAGYSYGEIAQYLADRPVDSSQKSWDVWGGIKDVGKIVYDLPTNTRGAIGDLFEDENPEARHTWTDQWREERDLRQAQRMSQPGGEDFVFPGIQRKHIREAGNSLGFSAVSMGAGLAGGLAAAPIPVPGSSLAGGTTASAMAAYNMDKTQFTQQLIHALRQAEAEQGRQVTSEDIDQMLSDTADLRQKHALWEAIPEAAGNVLALKGMGTLFKAAFGRFGEQTAAKVFKGLLGTYGGEMGTEIPSCTIS